MSEYVDTKPSTHPSAAKDDLRETMATAISKMHLPATLRRNSITYAIALLAAAAVVSAIVVAWFVLFFSAQAAGQYSTDLATNTALRFSSLFAIVFPATAVVAALASLATVPFRKAGARTGIAILAASTITGIAASAVSFAWSEPIQAAGMFPLLNALIGAYALAASLASALLSLLARRRPVISAITAAAGALITIMGTLLRR